MAGRVVCFGEMLLRLNAPQRELLLQSGRLDVWVGGAEANVAVSLAALGHPASMVTLLPDNPLGHTARAELRRHGVETEHVRFVPGRMGLYFMSSGAGQRPSQIVYDRRESAFALAPPEAIDWSAACAGAQWLHVSGITPALGAGPAAATLRAVREARARGLSISFDCNYRAQLWQASRSDPARGLRKLLEEADVAFADDRVLALVLGQDLERSAPAERFRSMAEHAFAAFPRLQCVTTLVRIEHSVDHHDLSAVLATRTQHCFTRSYSIAPIVDRIGTGDAFAAGVLHGYLQGLDPQATLDFGLATACLKHSVPGDFNPVGVADVQHLLGERGFAVRR
jgi:2-dehydro-3-deoxygluconokinase